MPKKLLQTKNIVKKYGTFSALKGISLDLYEAEIVSLLGVNGAGKTTLSAIIATLHPPTSGEILFNERSIFDDIPAYRKQIGYCAQKPNLNPLLTVKDNLIFAGQYYGMNRTEIAQKLEELDASLGIGHYLYHYPPQLSGGWKQRYMIARTLIHGPRLIILDEPTVALDPGVRHQLWHHIKKIRDSGVCILLTTHYIDEAEILSNRVCVLHNGEIKLIDTPANLMQSFQKGRLEEVFLQLTQEQ